MTALLEAHEVSKSYPGVRALDSVSFAVLPGEVHALVGENGAGKSTLMKMLGGVERSDAGTITGSDGALLNLFGPRDAQDAGIALIHQELNLVEDLSVSANMFLGREIRRGPFPQVREMDRKAGEVLERLGADIDPRSRVGELSLADAQLVEIAKALSMDARVLIMDEPTAALAETEAARLLSIVRDFLGPTTGVVFISHRLDEVVDIADRASVMRDGRLVFTGTEFTRAQLIAHMVGREVNFDARPASRLSELIVLEAKNITNDAVSDVSVSVRAGEIFGLAGLVGAGRTEFARALFGADPKSGIIKIKGRDVRTPTPEAAVRAGIGYVSEDRKRYGLVLSDTVQGNIALPSLERTSRFGVVDDAANQRTAEHYRTALRIKVPSVREQVRNLSGGNQQKVALAKWLAQDPEVLIVDEPTRGVDVGAKEEIYTLLDEVAAQGTAIIVISSEIAELQRLAHRIGVMCEGRLTGVLDAAEATQERIMELATTRNNS